MLLAYIAEAVDGRTWSSIAVAIGGILLLFLGELTLIYWRYRARVKASHTDKKARTLELKALYSKNFEIEKKRDQIKLRVRKGRDAEARMKTEYAYTGQQIEALQKRRPALLEAIYSIGVLGMRATGKTQLINRLTSHYFTYIEAMKVTATAYKDPQVVRLVRTTAHENDNSRLAEYIRFECYAGEHVKDAVTNLQRLCHVQTTKTINGLIPGIHGLIIVVDLAETTQDSPKDGETKIIHRHSIEQIQKNLREFPESVIKTIFQQPITDKLKTVILFVNKSDTVPSPPEQVEQLLYQWFDPLISTIRESFGPPEVIVGSVKEDIGITTLFSRLVQNIFPPDEVLEQATLAPDDESSEIPEVGLPLGEAQENQALEEQA